MQLREINDEFTRFTNSKPSVIKGKISTLLPLYTKFYNYTTERNSGDHVIFLLRNITQFPVHLFCNLPASLLHESCEKSATTILNYSVCELQQRNQFSVYSSSTNCFYLRKTYAGASRQLSSFVDH